MKFGVEYLAVLFLRGDVVAIDMRADGDTCHSVLLLDFFGSVPFGQSVIRLVFGKCRINVLLAVIVELADLDLWDIMLSGVCPYPFGVYLVLLRNLLGSIVFSNVNIVLRFDAFVWFGFQHQLDVGTADERHSRTQPGSTEFVLFHQLVNILTGDTHQFGRLGKCEVFLTLQLFLYFNHFLNLPKFHSPLFHAVFVTSLGALRTAIVCGGLLRYKRLAAPLADSFYFHVICPPYFR